MRKGIVVDVGAEDRARLAAIVADRNSPQKHVWRARIVLLTADGLGTVEIMRADRQEQGGGLALAGALLQAGVDGLLRDKTRPSRKPPLGPDGGRAGGGADPRDRRRARRPTGPAAMAKAIGIRRARCSASGAAHGLRRTGCASFKLSNDPRFAAKLPDVVGLYVDPPAHAVVLSIDEKSQIQALDRTQPGLPMKKGRAGTMTHDYKRHGTTTLFAALNVLDGTVIGRCMQRHRHQEFIRFLNAVERAGPGRQADPPHPRQLRHPQASQGLAPGSRAIPAGPSTSPRPRHRGSTRSRASSPS